ncbi:RNA pyrophosphohydrolase [Helicobacter sp. 23-1044]
MNQVNLNEYRPNVAAVILSERYPEVCEFFIAKRCDMSKKKCIWQFPQGGIDEGESPQEALFRELDEEIGTNKVEILAQYPQWLSYNFPPAVIKSKMYPFKGQRQKYFLVKLKSDSTINLTTQIPEFDSYKFVPFESVLENVVYFKRRIYKKVLEYFKKEGYF